MIIPKSDLELIEFAIINSNYSFHEPPDETEVNTRDLFSSYEMEIDFGASEPSEEDDNMFSFFVKLIINNSENPLPGYSLFCEGVGFFKISNLKDLPEPIANNLLRVSPLSISINNMRSYLMNITNYYPFGKFILPSIDISKLIASKFEEQSTQEEE